MATIVAFHAHPDDEVWFTEPGAATTTTADGILRAVPHRPPRGLMAVFGQAFGSGPGSPPRICRLSRLR